MHPKGQSGFAICNLQDHASNPGSMMGSRA
jgi:hypothetical protein